MNSVPTTMISVSTTMAPVSATDLDIIPSSDWIILDSTYVPTADVGVQTMPTAIKRVPVPSRTHPVPWGLGTVKSSPLTSSKSIANNSYSRGKKRKLQDILTSDDCTWPPRKKAAIQYDDYQLQDEYVPSKEMGVIETSTQFDFFVQVSHSNNGVRSVATNTSHVPFRREPLQLVRHKAWQHSAKKFLPEEVRDDRRRFFTRKDTIKRIADDILGYYCRRRETRVDRVKRMVDGILAYHLK